MPKIGEIDPKLKAKIDVIQEYIDFLWDWNDGRTNIVLKWIAYKDKLAQKI